jgi:hypothetical protein
MAIDDDRFGPDDVGTGRFRKLRAAVRVRCPVPAPADDEPGDDELLRYLDGLMTPEERTCFEMTLLDSPYAAARVEILASALSECGWAPPAPDDDFS